MILLSYLIFISSNVFAFTLVDTEPFTLWPTDEIIVDWSDQECSTSLSPYIDVAITKWNSIGTSRMKFKKGQNIDISALDAYIAYTGQSLTNSLIFCDADFETNIGIGYISATGPGVFNGQLLQGIQIINSDENSDVNMQSVGSMNIKHMVGRGMGHSAGLGFSQYSPSIMYPDTGSRTQFAPSQDDIDGLTYLYPKSAEVGDLLGCGTIRGLPPIDPNIFLTILIFPVILAFGLRRRSSAVRFAPQ